MTIKRGNKSPRINKPRPDKNRPTSSHALEQAWEFRLKYAQGLVDEWINCQRTWLYLEPIFSSEDIMRQLPTEARRFNSVDQLWKKVTAARIPRACLIVTLRFWIRTQWSSYWQAGYSSVHGRIYSSLGTFGARATTNIISRFGASWLTWSRDFDRTRKIALITVRHPDSL